MSQPSPQPPASARAPRARVCLAALATLRPVRTLVLWRQRARGRARLARLGADALADIGRTEAEREAECARWFWQGSGR